MNPAMQRFSVRRYVRPATMLLSGAGGEGVAAARSVWPATAGRTVSTAPPSPPPNTPTTPPPTVDQGLATSSSVAATSRRKVGDIDTELRAPRRATGLFSVKELEDAKTGTIGFGKLDEVESNIKIRQRNQGQDQTNALLALSDEERWQGKLMFQHKVVKTPKHLTWAELGREVECLEAAFELDEHRPEEMYRVVFYFRDRHSGVRDVVFEAKNDVSSSSALPDLLAAIGSCLGRSDVHRTVRFDDGVGTRREINLRKNSEFTSEIVIAFRPPVHYSAYDETAETMDWMAGGMFGGPSVDGAEAKSQAAGGDENEGQGGVPSPAAVRRTKTPTTPRADAEAAASSAGGLLGGGATGWGFHPSLMDPEYRDVDDPVGTYHLTISTHALSIVLLKALDNLVQRPLRDFYRPSQITQTVRAKEREELGIAHALNGWLGTDEKLFPHYTPLEAIEEHWFGKDSPFTLTMIVNKLRELSYLQPENPEFKSWMSVRRRDSAIAMRNLKVKMLGAGASTLFTPLSHNATVSRMLPKEQRRIVRTTVSAAGILGMPDETRKLDELKQIAESGKLLSPSASSSASTSTSTPTPSVSTPSGSSSSSSSESIR